MLAVSQERTIWIDDNGRIERCRIPGACESTAPPGSQLLPKQYPHLAAGPYFIRLVPADEAESTGTLTATVARGLPVQVFPRAFTFVSSEGFEPPAQTFKLSNKGERTGIVPHRTTTSHG